MNKNEKILSRREMLAMSIGLGGIALGGSVFAQETRRLFTPEIMMGPFYPLIKPLDTDADLTMVKGHKTRAAGEIIHVAGQVVNQNGEPVAGAEIELWQANKFGHYAHPSDKTTTPTDENFQGFAVLKTDAQGRYRFKTIKPGAYPISPTALRPPHIHFDIKGKNNRLVTQMFFPDEPLNEKDVLFQQTRQLFAENYKTVIAQKLTPTAEIATGETLLGWDIVLLNG